MNKHTFRRHKQERLTPINTRDLRVTCNQCSAGSWDIINIQYSFIPIEDCFRPPIFPMTKSIEVLQEKTDKKGKQIFHLSRIVLYQAAAAVPSCVWEHLFSVIVHTWTVPIARDHVWNGASWKASHQCKLQCTPVSLSLDVFRFLICHEVPWSESEIRNR